MAAFIRPQRQAYWFMALMVLLYIPTRFITDEPLLATVFTVGLSLMIGIGSIATAAMEDREVALTRSRDLDSHLAALGERERIARDLHDLLGHTLTMVAHKAELAEKLIDRDPVRSRRELIELGNEARSALGNVREAIRGMQMTTLHNELERTKVALRSADVQFQIIGEPPPLDRDTSQTLGLVIREAVTNIVRHSFASEATISFAQQTGNFEITVRDNGNGQIQRGGRGISGLRKRVEALDGHLQIETRNGTALILNLPIGLINRAATK